MDKVDILYEKYNVLSDAGEKAAEHEADYLHLLEAVKGSANEKRLASQFIAKFFRYFPGHADKAFDAFGDLCEDEDVNIRKQAIRDLPNICKETKELVVKVTDLLVQLLVSEDASELQIVNLSLSNLFRLHPENFLQGLFLQFDSFDDSAREKALKFLSTKIKPSSTDLWTKEVEEAFLQYCRKFIPGCTKDEFMVFVDLLSTLKITRLVSGQQVVAEIISEQAELDKPYNPEDVEGTDKLLMCIKSALPYLSPYVTSNLYAQYLTLQVVPQLNRVVEVMSTDAPGIDLEIVQLLAELTPSVHPTNTAKPIDLPACQEAEFKKLLEYIPLPPLDAGDSVEEPSLQLTHVESLLFAFHQFGKHNAEFLNDETKLKDFKLRLQYLARCVQNYSKKLKESLELAKKTKDALQTDENKMRLVALKTTNNISTLIRDLFHTPPSFKSQVTLSWKPIARAIVLPTSKVKEVKPDEPEVASNGAAKPPPKRKPIEAPEGSVTKVQKKVEKEVYAPPSGKFSGTTRGGFPYVAPRGRGGFIRGTNRGRYSKRFN
ncbi:Apoptosis inhibitor 5 [Halotydeus destructor]|nr:Apoptosis inhibitor 5 [Halotydeus destructor]